jgi:hypothetical protein
MPAYQYFWLNGHVVGRAPAGTMGFASQPAFDKWHFQQFAQYSLLAANQKLVMRSQKVGFCIAPTDPVNLLLPGAIWQPSAIGLTDQCGSSTALWVQELLQTGWGDTYVQSLPDQAFDITSLPNGTYYIAVTANPMKTLYERTTSNDTALREVILGGSRGNRTVKVPAWEGIDPEG